MMKTILRTPANTSQENSSLKSINSSLKQRGSVVDVFCGAGGLTHGFRLEGFSVAAGIDIDESCRFAYESNNNAPFLCKDARELAAIELNQLFFKGQPRILVGCAPCQPFSTYNQKNDDPNWGLVGKFSQLIVETLPDIVSMENVPRLLDFRGGSVFSIFVSALERVGYHVQHKVVYLPDYGVPQRRKRVVLLASLHGEISLETPNSRSGFPATVAEAIGSLPKLEAGQIDLTDPLHRSSRLSELNLKRIRASKPGGSWKEWNKDLIADCHKAESGKTYGGVYGRMKADEVSPTITTQFYGFGNGRFGHPTQDRGLSLREGAILQSFPPTYKFIKPGTQIRFKGMGKMIGNAVPVELGRAIARSINNHIIEYNL